MAEQEQLDTHIATTTQHVADQLAIFYDLGSSFSEPEDPIGKVKYRNSMSFAMRAKENLDILKNELNLLKAYY
jgi:hypothetical protein